MMAGYGWKRLADVGGALKARRALDERDLWPRDRLLAYQTERLGELVAFASRHSAFYRELYGGPVDGNAVTLAQLPTVDKATMMTRFDDVVTDARLRRTDLERHIETLRDDELYVGEFRVMASSGTTGRHGIYVYDRAAWRVALAGLMRYTKMIGAAPRVPRRKVAAIGAPGGKQMTYRMSKSLDTGINRMCRLAATESLDRLVAALNDFQPEVINAYPSVAAMLAAEQLDGRLRIQPRVVSTSSEVRTPEMTERMRKAWNIEPYNLLGLTETGVTAVDCAEHRGMHVFEDTCIVEIVDERNRPVPAGTPGARVLVTNLYNRAQPLIRFEVSDIMTADDTPCACGRSSRRITAIDGRTDDVLELPGQGGRTVRVHPIHFADSMSAQTAIAQYQIVQRPDHLDVRLIMRADATAPAACSAVKDSLGRQLAGLGVIDTPIHVNIVEQLEREAAGKLKLIKRAL